MIKTQQNTTDVDPRTERGKEEGRDIGKLEKFQQPGLNRAGENVSDAHESYPAPPV